MTSSPLVSIAMPTYNGAAFLAATLRSAQSQDWENLEIVIADDCSTDGTLEIARAAARADSRIRLLERPHNLGPALNQRELYAAVHGEFLKPLLQDDTLEPDAVTRLVQPLIADRSLAFSTSRRRLIDQYGWPLDDVSATAQLSTVTGTLNAHSVAELMLGTTCNQIGEVSTVLMRSALVASTSLWWWGSYCFTTNADIWLWLQLLGRGDLWYETETLSSFRIHPGQSSRDRRTGVIGVRDWVRLLEAAPGLGFLADIRTTRTAAARVLSAAAYQLSLVDEPELVDTLGKACQDLFRLVGSRENSPLDRSSSDHVPLAAIQPEGCEFVLRPDWSDPSSLRETIISYVRALDATATSSLVIVRDLTTSWSADETGRFVARTLADNGHDPEMVSEIVVTDGHRLAKSADGRRRIWIGQPGDDTTSEWSPAPSTPDGYRTLASVRRTTCMT